MGGDISGRQVDVLVWRNQKKVGKPEFRL